jgi:hypothetical protein
VFGRLTDNSLIIQAGGISLPESRARIHQIDLKAQGIKSPDRALASLVVLAKLKRIITRQMLEAALKVRFKGKVLEASLKLVEQVKAG